MRIAVLVLAATIPAGNALAQDEAGKEIYDKWCTPCHGTGPGKPGTTVLGNRYGDSIPGLLEERTDLTAEFVETFVRKGVGVMPPFRKTEITDAELELMIDYLVR